MTASPTNCDGATWNTGAGSWEITVTETPVETCRLVASTGRAVAEDLGNVSIFGAKTSGGSGQCDGATYSFGTESTDNTVLGHGDIMVPGEVVARPRRIEALRGVHACGVSVGEHCLLYDAAGRLYSWGRAEL